MTAAIEDKLSRAILRKQVASEKLRDAQERRDAARHWIDACEKATIFLQTEAKALQETLRFRLQDVVNAALNAVFPGQYEFIIEFTPRRGNSEVDFTLKDLRTGGVRDIFNDNGGGLADIVAFCLRVATMLIARVRRLLILDEAMKFVSPDMKGAAYEIFEVLIRQFEIQVIANTHDVADMTAVADREFKFKRDRKGVTQVGVVDHGVQG